jgi:hypothetical protein
MNASTPRGLIEPTATDRRREALFASELQPSDTPTNDVIACAITAAIRRFGSLGCSERMAQEFGDHPDVAAERMRWASRVAA